MHVSALSDGYGKPIDWWFIYKLPRGVGPGKHSTGDEFLYCDSAWNPELHLSKYKLNDTSNAVTQTLKQIFSGNSSAGYVLWNDEIPPTRGHSTPMNNSSKGHSKGILAFDKKTDSGFYLLHSTPRFPAESEIELPDDEREYGQTFLCVTLRYSTTVQIAEILRIHNEPQVYASKNLPEDVHSPLLKLARLQRESSEVRVESRSDNHAGKSSSHRASGSRILIPSCDANEPAVPVPVDFKFRSRDRNEFRLFAKNKRWSEPASGAVHGKDFWNHLVGPALRDNIDVETWRRGQVFANVEPNSHRVTMDVLGVNLASIGYHGYQWPFTKDHAKWGSTEHRPAGFLFRHPGFVVIADINRDETQAKRSGGGLAFQHDGIWRAFKSIEKIETAVNKASQKSSHGKAA